MKMKAVLFDCDGLMFDTERVAQDMWRDIGRSYGVEIPDDLFVAITGVKDTRALTPYFETVPHLQDILDASRKKRFDLEFWSSFYPDGLNKKGLVALNRYLNENHIPCCVCSSSKKEYVETLLRTVSVPLHFDSIVGGDMVEHGKPDPDIFLLGASILGVEAENCLVLEDSKMGILAAKRAGMHSCFIQDTIKPDDEMRENIEFEKEDLSQVIDLLEEVR